MRSVRVLHGSDQNLLDHLAVDVGQPEVAAGVPVGESLVVQPQQVQDGRVQVVDVHLVLDHRRSEAHPALGGEAMHAVLRPPPVDDLGVRRATREGGRPTGCVVGPPDGAQRRT